MGGTDDPTNLIELTVEEHAEAHRKLFEAHGKVEDYVAWAALSGIIGQEEVQLELRKLGRQRADEVLAERYGPEWRSILAKLGSAKGVVRARELGVGVFDPDIRKKGQTAALSKTARAKRKAAFKANGHQQAEKNSMFGRRWITDGVNNQVISGSESIPEGWRKGRTC